MQGSENISNKTRLTRAKRPVVDRLDSKIKTGPGCWEWTGAKNPAGYGHFFLNYKVVMAHRMVYETAVGPIAPGLFIDHLCRNKSCVNPDHLEPVTPSENILRGDLPEISRQRLLSVGGDLGRWKV